MFTGLKIHADHKIPSETVPGQISLSVFALICRESPASPSGQRLWRGTVVNDGMKVGLLMQYQLNIFNYFQMTLDILNCTDLFAK
jgi:hypothetical protein